jgi:hypothetical protein
MIDVKSDRIDLRYEKPRVQDRPYNNLFSNSGLYVPYGLDNRYPYDLVEYSDRSPTHRNIMETKASWTAGAEINGESNLVTQANRFGETLHDVWTRACRDMALYGGYALELMFSQGVLQEILYIDFGLLRVSKTDKMGVTEYLYSRDWRNGAVGTVKRKAYRYQEINPSGSRVYRCFKGTITNPFYPTPEYSTAMPYIDQIYQAGIRGASFLEISLSATGILHVPGLDGMSEEEQQDYTDNIKKFFQHSSVAGQVMIDKVTGGGPENETKFTPIELKYDKDTIEVLMEKADEQICMSHGFSLTMAGIRTRTGLSSKQSEIVAENQYYYATKIQPKQREFASFFRRLTGIDITIVSPLPEVVVVDGTQTTTTDAGDITS